jgi:short-subunit dehydrogenase
VLDVSREDFIGRLASATNDLDIGLVVSNADTGNPGDFLKLDRQLLEETLRLTLCRILTPPITSAGSSRSGGGAA